MSLPDDRNVTMVVIEIEPGRIFVKVAGPRLGPERLELLLQRTIEHWFSNRPQFVIDRSQAAADDGEIQGIDVWYHVNDGRPRPVEAAPPQRPDSLTIEVSNQILHRLPKEHVEAVIDEAMQVCRSQEDRHGTLVVVNSRRMAVILDRQANRAAVLPVEMIYPRIDDSTRAGVQAWLEAPTARRLEFQIAGSWFMPQRVESRRSEVKEPAFLHTNMTYDAPPKG